LGNKYKQVGVKASITTTAETEWFDWKRLAAMKEEGEKKWAGQCKV